ncbi:hypothetical protein HMPREF3213_02804 [Heyndrickxia coagulans]|uniref:Uncharacterized protein n=1 Tax=Heyndrickxia coagulans TaxID=1398 RepID=A0A133KHN6_HEYCO|nr:hypothetical protein HMPREF3213_02804 [Heyndrickxia coagulans]
MAVTPLNDFYILFPLFFHFKQKNADLHLICKPALVTFRCSSFC